MSRRTQTSRARSAWTSGAAALSILVLAAIVVLATAVSASAVEGLGEQKPSGLSALNTALIFFGIPALVFAVVFALVYGLSRNTEPRLREGQAWWSEPEYYSKDGVAADGAAPAASGADQPRTTDGGGTGATW